MRSVFGVLGLFAGLLAIPAFAACATNAPGPPPEPEAYRNPIVAGDEIVMVLVTSSGLIGERDGFPQAVTEIRRELQRRADAAGMHFRAVGVSLDGDTETGLNTLTRVGEFDELAVGSNWMNSAVLRYILVDYEGPTKTPQLVLLKRFVTVEPIGVETEEVILRVMGGFGIIAWLNDGLPMPEGSLEGR
jgi:hypothetical protein